MYVRPEKKGEERGRSVAAGVGQRRGVRSKVTNTSAGSADLMKGSEIIRARVKSQKTMSKDSGIVRVIQPKLKRDKLNVIGESHTESDLRRDQEKTFLSDNYGFAVNQYWKESEFKGAEVTAENIPKRADPIIDHVRRQLLAMVNNSRIGYDNATLNDTGVSNDVINFMVRYRRSVMGGFLDFFGPNLTRAGYEHQEMNFPVDDAEKLRLQLAYRLTVAVNNEIATLRKQKAQETGRLGRWNRKYRQWRQRAQRATLDRLGAALHALDMAVGNTLYVRNKAGIEGEANLVDTSRETAMANAATRAQAGGITGAWKIGDDHAKNRAMQTNVLRGGVALTLKDEFDKLLNPRRRRRHSVGSSSHARNRGRLRRDSDV